MTDIEPCKICGCNFDGFEDEAIWYNCVFNNFRVRCPFCGHCSAPVSDECNAILQWNKEMNEND